MPRHLTSAQLGPEGTVTSKKQRQACCEVPATGKTTLRMTKTPAPRTSVDMKNVLE